MIHWDVDHEVRTQFEQAGLADFDRLINEPLGELVAEDSHDRQVRRLKLSIDGETKTFYLKRCGRERLTHYLRMLLLGQRPLAAPLREKKLLDIIQKAGFPVMETVAWGERRSFGLPCSGFLLTSEVQGREVANVFATLPLDDRRNLMREIGAFVGRLHASGLYQPVRLKDLFISEGSDLSRGEVALILIDRETGKPWGTKFSWAKCVNSLARGLRRTWREGYRVGPFSLKAFASGYLGAIGRHCRVSRKDLFRQVYVKIKQLNR